ncbi:MAG: hypothetical protein ACRD2R_02525 [Terriglobales bacterium]
MADDDVTSSPAGGNSQPDQDFDDKYTAFQEWKYDRVFYEEEHPRLWLDLGESFYGSARILIESTAKREVNEGVEGIAGLFLFRHYLELALKHIIVAGRWLTSEGDNAQLKDGAKVERIHVLHELWQLVLRDAKPKIREEHWKNYDIEFVERCLEEFDKVDPKGFAFRYAGHGVERLRAHFEWLAEIMDHVHQVLEGISVYLTEMYHQNEEYDAYLQAEYGADLRE